MYIKISFISVVAAMMKYYSVPLAALLLVLLVLLVLHLGRAPVPLDPANSTTPKTVRTDTARVRKSTVTDKRKKSPQTRCAALKSCLVRE